MKTPIAAFEAADLLDSPKDRADYLSAIMAKGDPAAIMEAVGAVARVQGIAAVAREAGLARESLYRSLSKQGNPNIRAIMKVLDAMGLQLSMTVKGDASKEPV